MNYDSTYVQPGGKSNGDLTSAPPKTVSDENSLTIKVKNPIDALDLLALRKAFFADAKHTSTNCLRGRQNRRGVVSERVTHTYSSGIYGQITLEGELGKREFVVKADSRGLIARIQSKWFAFRDKLSKLKESLRCKDEDVLKDLLVEFRQTSNSRRANGPRRGVMPRTRQGLMAR
ncbi:hypothetical protein HYT84_01925 [Candidatus Micrarchaeota archaeon]|nr:hypothetical protein [Candidatus Micrarchaeota archaeon]